MQPAPDAPFGSTFDVAFDLRPNLHESWQRFEALLWSAEGAVPEAYALCRARLAQMNGSRVCPGSAGPVIEAARLAALPEWWKSDLFSDVERACLGFAEQFALDPSGIGDDVAKPVTEALGDAGTIAFVEALAIFDGFTRFCSMLAVSAAADTASAAADTASAAADTAEGRHA